jgi:hypothetical protein
MPPNGRAIETKMAKIGSIVIGHYRISLPEILTDSTHGIMRDFELVTAQVSDSDGAGGTGYTFTVGRNATSEFPSGGT